MPARILIACFALIFASACSRNDGPTSPTAGTPAAIAFQQSAASTQPPPAAGTATINGAVAGAGAPASIRPQWNVSGLTVSIVGADISAPISATGLFVLQRVPPGDRELRFTGPGLDARVSLAHVQDAEVINLTIRINGSTVAIESEHRGDSGSPHPPENPGNPGNPGDGDDGDDGDDGQDESASIEGPLTAMVGAIPNLTLTVDGTTVRTNASTDVRRRGDVQTLTTLRLGMTLHVVGVRASDGSLTARMVQIKGDAAGGVFEIEGSLGGEHGTCPSIQFVVNGYSIVTDGSTTFNPSCAALRPGAKVTVVGVRQADGVVKATRVDKH